MALIDCPECDNEVSSSASACPQCGHPLKAQRKFKGPPDECTHCGGSLSKEKKAQSEGVGCLVTIIGLVFSPFLLGIPIAIYGIHLMSKREALWRCNKCEATFPRKIRWYEFG